MIFFKNFRIFRGFATLNKASAFQKESPTINWIKREEKDKIWEVCLMNNRNKIAEFSLNSKKKFNESGQKNNLNDRFFELSLLYIKTKDTQHMEDMKNLEIQVIENSKVLYEFLNNTMAQKEIDKEKLKNLLRNVFGINILSILSQKSELRLDALLSLFQQYQRVSNSFDKLSTNEKENLEIFYLILSVYRLFGLKIHKIEQDSMIIPYREFLPSVFKALKLHSLFKKILLNSFQNQNNQIQRDLLHSEMLWNIYSMLSSKENISTIEHDEFLSLLWELNIIETSPLKLKVKILLDIMFKTRVNKQFSHKFSMFSVTLIHSISKKLPQVHNSDLSQILYLISKENTSKYNYSVIMNFWEQVVEVFPQKYLTSAIIQQKGLIYSLGKSGFLSEEIKEKIFREELENMKKIESFQENDRMFEKYLNILKAGVNLKVFSREDFHCFIEIIGKAFEKYPEKKMQIIFEIAPFAIRMKYLDLGFWSQFFKGLESKVLEKGQKHFQIFFILKVLHFVFNGTFRFFGEGENKKQHSDVFYLFSEALKIEKINELFKRPLLYYYQEELDQENRKINAKNSLLEETMSKCLNALGTPFVSQTSVEFMIVDFYLPLENIIVEVMGPSHFIKIKGTNNDQMTLLTDFKLKCLKDLGFGLILIDHDQEVKKGFSIEQSFLKQYKEIVKN